MSVEKLVVRVAGALNVHVERHVFHDDADSVILINGALATTASFGQTIKYLSERYNVVCFDLPYAGQSRQYNPSQFLLTKDDEVVILLELIHQFRPRFLYSVSWGGLAALLALAQGRSSVERAVIGSFSPFLNAAMMDYVTKARDYLRRDEATSAAQLLNDTVGQNLPRVLKLMNYRYLISLPEEERAQIEFHIDQILNLHLDHYLPRLSNIQCGIKFINGKLDRHTTVDDILKMAGYIRNAQFSAIADTGHFLELEGRPQKAAVRGEIMAFFGAAEASAVPQVRIEPFVAALQGTTFAGAN
jgi:rhamnosyltransferase subunit A